MQVYKMGWFFEKKVKLPLNLDQFEKFASDIFKEFQLEDSRDNQFQLARMVQMLDPTVMYVPKKYFGYALNKMHANQAAFEIMSKIKEEAKKEEADKKASESEASFTLSS